MEPSRSLLDDCLAGIPSLPFSLSSAAPLRQSSAVISAPYGPLNTSPCQSLMEPSVDKYSQVHGEDDHASAAGAPTYVFTYGLKEYACAFITSHTDTAHVTPMIYRGESITGTVQFPQYRLKEVQSIIVVLRDIDSGLTFPTPDGFRLLSGRADPSHIVNGDYRGPFSIMPPTTATLKFELQITIHRRGLLNRKIRIKLPIKYSTRPDSTNSNCSLSSKAPARSLRSLPSSWKSNDNYPRVLVKGEIFERREPVEVECKLVIPISYPACDRIPLRLVMTSESRDALELVSVSHIINVRLLQVLVFGGKPASSKPPFDLKNRKSYHMTKWVAKANWFTNHVEDSEELPPDPEHPTSRWHTKLEGELCREPDAEISYSFAAPGLAIKHYVCLFPFSVPEFHPTSDPDRVLFYGQIMLFKY